MHKSLIGPEDITEDKPVEPGRVLRVCILGPQRVRVFWSIRNHGLTKEQHESIGRQLTEGMDKYNERRLAVVWVGGDWKFLAPGDSRFSPAMTRADEGGRLPPDPDRGPQ